MLNLMAESEPTTNDPFAHDDEPRAIDAEIIEAELAPVVESGLPRIRTAPGSVEYQFGSRKRTASVPPSYQVPRRFGTAAILGFTTLMAMMFAIVRFFGGPWWMYVFLSSLIFTTAVAQMVFRMGPRLSSAVSGSVLLPVLTIVTFAIEASKRPNPPSDFWSTLLCTTPVAAIFGALAGYLAGTLGAGVFLVLDQLDSALSRDDE